MKVNFKGRFLHLFRLQFPTLANLHYESRNLNEHKTHNDASNNARGMDK